MITDHAPRHPLANCRMGMGKNSAFTIRYFMGYYRVTWHDFKAVGRPTANDNWHLTATFHNVTF